MIKTILTLDGNFVRKISENILDKENKLTNRQKGKFFYTFFFLSLKPPYKWASQKIKKLKLNFFNEKIKYFDDCLGNNNSSKQRKN